MRRQSIPALLFGCCMAAVYGVGIVAAHSDEKDSESTWVLIGRSMMLGPKYPPRLF